ncbi:MAG: [FeFe] hydrogenase H-cluster maturation GTPase HydF [Bacteroidales bacterium]|nr:[FeFe] hydrogenase H-cluster maturation GTPase HydF [Bacteroidales bacterium]
MQKGKEQKPHIGIYGRRNYGKSSFINSITGQDIAIVSDVAGTTTDPVKKSYEITGFGPVVLIDTAGLDDEGEIGQKRIKKTLETLSIIDLAILIITQNTFDDFEKNLIHEFQKYDIPYLVIYSKIDIYPPSKDFINEVEAYIKQSIILFSVHEPQRLNYIIPAIKQAIPESAYSTPTLVGDLIKQGDIVLLITPIDVEAPEGRLILPQVQVIRDVLDNDAICIILKEREVDAFLRNTQIQPALAITDSQLFLKAAAMIPENIPLTGFSVLLAHYKGHFQEYLKGTPKISELKDGDRILLLESCTHHVSCDDIGRVKIPRWISQFTGKNLHFDVVAGLSSLQRPITDYALVIQCGGCMITRKQLFNRLKPAIDAGIPVTNYGMTIAYVQGVYNRAIAPFVKGQQADYL